MQRCFLLLLLLLLPIIAPAHARTVRVTTYPQLHTACQSAKPDDTILLAPGTYTLTNATRIAIDNRPGPILVKGETGNPGDVIIEGQGQDNKAVPIIFDLTNSPRWTFQDLTTRNTYFHGFKFNGSSTDCTLRNVIMRDHGESGVKGTSNPALGVYPDRLLVEHCDIGFTTPRGGTRDVVEGIDGVGVNNWIIRNTRFLNVLKASGDVAYAVFTKGNSSDTLIENNRFENCAIGASFGGGGTGTPYFRDNNRVYEHSNGIIRNNIFIHCTDAAIYLNKSRNAKIYHNTLFECVLTIQARYPTTSADIRNNLIKPSPNSPDEPTVRVRDNATLLANEANQRATNADFLKPTGKDHELDLHLRPTSPAIGKATPTLPPTTTDADNLPRPTNKTNDIGAYEFKVDEATATVPQIYRYRTGKYLLPSGPLSKSILPKENLIIRNCNKARVQANGVCQTKPKSQSDPLKSTETLSSPFSQIVRRAIWESPSLESPVSPRRAIESYRVRERYDAT